MSEPFAETVPSISDATEILLAARTASGTANTVTVKFSELLKMFRAGL